MVAQASGHCRGDPQRFVDSGEVVIDRVDRNHSRVILNFLAESVCEAGKAPHSHSHRQIVTLHVGRGYMLRVWVTAGCPISRVLCEKWASNTTAAPQNPQALCDIQPCTSPSICVIIEPK